jgi:hypothetical protein
MNLVTAAHNLRRKVYASLPWGFRLANLLAKLSSSSTDEWGRAAYGVFLMYGVEGMPPIDNKGTPPEVPKSFNTITRTLPRGYGSNFGDQVFKTLLKHFGAKGGLSAVEDYMSMGLTKLMEGGAMARGLKGKTVDEASKYVLRSIVNLALNVVRKTNKEKSLTDQEGIEEVLADPNNPETFRNLGDELPEETMAEIKKDLAKLNPELIRDLPLYFELLTEGVSKRKIVMDQMLPFLKDNPMSPQGWMKDYDAKIKKVLLKRLKDN